MRHIEVFGLMIGYMEGELIKQFGIFHPKKRWLLGWVWMQKGEDLTPTQKKFHEEMKK